MNIFLKQFFALVGIVLAVLGIIFGAILPFRKSVLYIQAMNNIQNQQIRTLNEFKENFNVPLDFYSPVGQEESAGFLAQIIVNEMIYPEQQEVISRELVNYIESRLEIDNSKHLVFLTIAYRKMFDIYNNKKDLEKTYKYYQKLLTLNPKSPFALYGLFDIYRIVGEVEKAKEISETILKYWPEDERIRQLTTSNQ